MDPMPQQTQSKTTTLEDKIKAAIESLPPDGGVTLAGIRDLIGQDCLLIFAAFLTIVFLVPVSIPGVSTVFGAAILLIGISRLVDRNLWLPKRIAQRILPSDKLRNVLMRGSLWLHRLERISRHQRLSRLTATGLTATLNNCGLIAGAVLLMAPFGLVPFSNTLPALALLFLSIGLLQRDGLFILYGHISNFATIIYFAILVAGGRAAIIELFRYFTGASS